MCLPCVVIIKSRYFDYRTHFHMFSLLDKRFVLFTCCSRALHVLRAQRIMEVFLISITHKSTWPENPIAGCLNHLPLRITFFFCSGLLALCKATEQSCHSRCQYWNSWFTSCQFVCLSVCLSFHLHTTSYTNLHPHIYQLDSSVCLPVCLSVSSFLWIMSTVRVSMYEDFSF